MSEIKRLSEDDVFACICRHNIIYYNAIPRCTQLLDLQGICAKLPDFDDIDESDISETEIKKILSKLVAKNLIRYTDDGERKGYEVTIKGMQTDIYQDYEYEKILDEEFSDEDLRYGYDFAT